MKEILLDELDDNNSFFHFTREENLQSISEKGLRPKIGENSSFAEEEQPTIFFSKGKKGILENCDVWLKWYMYHAYNEDNFFGLYTGVGNVKAQVENWYQEFYSRTYLQDKEKQEKFFSIIEQKMRHGVYLSLDLKEQEDFDYDEYDCIKARNLKEKSLGNSVRYETSKEMYGTFSNVDSTVVDSWNMHVKPNRIVNKEKIKQVITKEGNKDMLSVVTEVYKNKSSNEHYDLLDKFMDYEYKKTSKNQELNDMLNEYTNQQTNVIEKNIKQ